MEQNIVTVSELTGNIKSSLENSFDFIRVTGELSNFKLHSSGHRYFTLKDEGASISCVMWRGRQIDFKPSDGMKVVIAGGLTVYPQRGNYQIDCISMEKAGQGELWLAFEELKKQLESKGYFDRDRKKVLPNLPLAVGVATSSTGAAIRDIFSTIERRFKPLEIYFRPTIVQGDSSGVDIAKAIIELNKLPIDVIIVGRGGGSLEDLWGFNTIDVAQAIYESNVPIISAVGHETDFSISDFVADVRAATPTAAAELVTPITQDSLYENILRNSEYMHKFMNSNITNMRELLKRSINEKAKKRVLDFVNMNYQFIDDSTWRINSAINNIVKLQKQNLNGKAMHIKSLSPYAPLKKGYAIIKNNGKVIAKNHSLLKFKSIEIQREIETIDAKVVGIKQDKLF